MFFFKEKIVNSLQTKAIREWKLYSLHEGTKFYEDTFARRHFSSGRNMHELILFFMDFNFNS